MSSYNFSARLAFVMERNGANQSDVARALGTSQATVSRWLGGSMPRIGLAGKLAQFLDCRMEWLLDGQGEEPGRFSVYSRPDLKSHFKPAKLPELGKIKAWKDAMERAKEKFPFRLKRLREQTGLSVNEFARRVGCTAAYISRLEGGSRINPSMKFLEKLTENFGVNRRWLLNGERPVKYIPPRDWPRVFPTVDVSMLDKLDDLDRSENKASQAELRMVLDSLSKTFNPKEMAVLIKELSLGNFAGDYADSMADILKDLLVKKLSGK